MKLTERSDAELSLWICERLESRKGCIGATTYVQAWGQNRGSRFWRTEPVEQDSKKYEWQPRDMVNDPAMTLMLLEKLDCEMQTRINDGVTVRIWLKELDEHGYPKTVWISHAKLGRAVAMAYALAHGFTEE